MAAKRSVPRSETATDEDVPFFSVYDGRIYLGRYTHPGVAKFEAFDQNDLSIGSFCKLEDVVRAIIQAGGQV